MKIKAKTYLLSILISLLFSVLYLFVLSQLHGLDGKITRAMIASRMRELAVEARRLEEDFLQTGNPEKAKRISSNLQEIVLVAKRSESTFKLAMPRDFTNEIVKWAGDYEAAFKEILKLKQEIAAAEEKLGGQSERLETAVMEAMKELKSGSPVPSPELRAVQVDKIALAHKILKQGYVVARPNTPRSGEPFSKIQAAINQFLREWERDVLIEAASGYVDAFQALVQLQEMMDARIEALHEIARALEDVSSKTFLEMNKKRDEAKSAMMMAILVAFSACGLLVLSLSFWFSSILTGPIVRLRRAMLQIARGNLDATLNIYSHDEIGELEESFRIMGGKLKDSYEQLKKMDELKSRFIAAASHELKTPLTSVKGYVEIVLNEEAGPINEEQKEYLGYVKQSTDRLQRLLKELLDISKIESGRATLKRELTDLKILIKEEQVLFNPQAREKGTELSTDTEPALKPVYCDADKIREVLDNLLSNAIKYTPAHGKVRIFARNHARGVEIGIQDNGIGIKKEDQGRIFEPFQHLDQTGAESEESTGLGLTLTKKIVEAHGGQIQVQSEGKNGATFTVLLPFDMTRANLNELIGRD